MERVKFSSLSPTELDIQPTLNLGLILRFITALQILVKITNSDPSCLVSRLGPAGAFEPYVYVLYEPNFGTRAFKPNLAPPINRALLFPTKYFVMLVWRAF